MRSFLKLAALCGSLLLAGVAIAEKKSDSAKPADQKKTADKKKEEQKTRESQKKPRPLEGATEEEDKKKMSFPLPEGHDAKGLVIPYREGDARKTMNFVIGTATRIDADQVSMGDLQIATFDENSKPEMSIDLPKSILNLNTRVVTTKTKVTIKRAEFELTANTMEFNTLTKEGRVGGNVKMLIYNIDDAEPPKKKEAPEANPKVP